MAALSDATAAVARAREVDAAELSPFELHFAELHLEKAREEAAEASYQDAARFAEVARTYGERAAAQSLGRRNQAPNDTEEAEL